MAKKKATAEVTRPQTILRLKVEDVLRLKFIELRPDSDWLQLIGGKNAQGKSSILKSIKMALKGARSVDDKPVREGADGGQIIMETQDFRLLRRVYPDGASELTMRAQDGTKITSPQKLLDAMRSSLSFDPLAFSRKTTEEQVAQLRELVGVDTTQVDAEIAEVKERRLELSREVRNKTGELAALPFHDDAPREAVSIADLYTSSEAVRSHNESRQALVDAVATAEDLVTRTEDDIEEIRRKIEDLKTQGARLKQRLGEEQAAVTEAEEALEAFGPEKDAGDLAEKIKETEAANAKVAANRAREAANDRLDEATEQHRRCNDELDALLAKRRALLQEADFPIPGLEIDEDHGVVFKGQPFAQASQAEQVRVSTSIGMALAPDLRVMLIAEGALLDSDSRAEIARLAGENECQVWLEVVTEDGSDLEAECAIVLDDGEAKDVAGA